MPCRGRRGDDHRTIRADGRLQLLYRDQQVADLSMEFLHDGRPPVVREATYRAGASRTDNLAGFCFARRQRDFCSKILGSLNVCSKEWVIRQYDHEVQGGSVDQAAGRRCKTMDRATPRWSDRCSVRTGGWRLRCGMNPRYGDFDTYHMAAGAIDEAIRNCVAVGADPSAIAILDNFCWGDCERPETFGSLVRAAIACHDMAVALGTPFISGKDSLNNEFRYVSADGKKQSIAIPPTLLISALGQVEDVRRCVTMDLKQAGNVLYLVGDTKAELGWVALGAGRRFDWRQCAASRSGAGTRHVRRHPSSNSRGPCPRVPRSKRRGTGRRGGRDGLRRRPWGAGLFGASADHIESFPIR